MSKDKVPYSQVSKGSVPSAKSKAKPAKINTGGNRAAGKGDTPRHELKAYADNYDDIKWN